MLWQCCASALVSLGIQNMWLGIENITFWLETPALVITNTARVVLNSRQKFFCLCCLQHGGRCPDFLRKQFNIGHCKHGWGCPAFLSKILSIDPQTCMRGPNFSSEIVLWIQIWLKMFCLLIKKYLVFVDTLTAAKVPFKKKNRVGVQLSWLIIQYIQVFASTKHSGRRPDFSSNIFRFSM